MILFQIDAIVIPQNAIRRFGIRRNWTEPIVNMSLTSGHFHPILKESVICPLLTKPTLDKNQLSNYRPISSHSLISEIIERVVKSRLTDHLVSNGLLNPH